MTFKDTSSDDEREGDDDNKKKYNSHGMKNVWMLSLVSFFTDFSTEMILAVLPTFVVNNLGASKAILGIIEGSAELTSYAFRMISGSLSDKFRKRKIFVIIGYGLSTITKPFFIIATGWIDAFVIRTMDRMGKGIRTAPRDALIADSVTESISGKAFGIHRTIDQMGAIIGPITAFFILQTMNIQTVFLLSLIPGAIAVFILIFFVKEVAIKKLSSTTSIFQNIGTLLNFNKGFVILVVITGIFSLGAFNFSFVLIRSEDLGVGQSFVPIVYALINVSHTAIGIPAGIVADKIGKEKVLLIGYVVFIISSLFMLSAVNNVAYAYILALIFGIYIGITETVQRAIIPKYVAAELRGTAYGFYSLVLGICFFVSNLTFGFIWDSFGIIYAVFYSVCLSVISVIGITWFMKKYANISIN